MTRPELRITPGPWLLRSRLPDLSTHRATHGELPDLTLEQLQAVVGAAAVRGRGGAGFPFAIKLATTAARGRHRHVVVNLSEGEPASHKDLALTLTQPHLVLDGALVAARALRVRTIHLTLPRERPEAQAAIELALAERRATDRRARVRWEIHLAAPRFVSGEASAVTELIDGRLALPVTSWEPTAVSGVRGRPTLLSNGETFAHVAAAVLDGGAQYAALGTPEEPGTSLLSLAEESGAVRVLEVPHGTAWQDVLGVEKMEWPVLLGGYHGTWVPGGGLRGRLVSRADLASQGLTLGAGIVLPVAPGSCPLEHTARIVRYLAGESAGRCGPCLNGLPALATAVEAAVAGHSRDGRAAIDELAGYLVGRGACAHPDGTVRMVRSALDAFPAEVEAHRHGTCLSSQREGVWA